MTSIRRHVLLWLLGALTLSAVLLALGTYAVTLEEMNEVFDNELKQVALTVLTYHQKDVNTANHFGKVGDDNDDYAFVTQVWTHEGSRIFTSVPDSKIPFIRVEGFQTVAVRDGLWRVYTTRSTSNLIQAAQPIEARQALAANIALKILIPGLIAAPLLALLMAYALKRGLQPLARTSQDVERKSAQSLEAISETSLPSELRPLVASINALMARLSIALVAQRQFIADAAHELRTPLTALKLQVQLLEQATDVDARNEAIADIRNGLERATHLVGQLLNLSRLEPDAESLHLGPVHLAELVKSVVIDFSNKAESRHIDLGAEIDASISSDTVVEGDTNQLRILLNNVVDNALRYTPAGGRVDVSIHNDAKARTSVIAVRDSGPGIPIEERGRVFDRFYRANSSQGTGGVIPGTGLGLAIVKAIANRHNAVIDLTDGLPNASGSSGLEVRVSFHAKKV